MNIDVGFNIIDATVDKVTPTTISLNTVTATLTYNNGTHAGYKISKLIPMSQPSVIIPNLILPYSEIHLLPSRIQASIRTISKSGGK